MTSGASADGLCTDAVATTRDSVGGADTCVVDPTDPVDPVDPTDPVDPVDPADPEETDGDGLSQTLLIIIIAGSGAVGLILLFLFCKFGMGPRKQKITDNRAKQEFDLQQETLETK